MLSGYFCSCVESGLGVSCFWVRPCMDFGLTKSCGPPRLEKLCVKTLLDYKGYISDIGDTPIASLYPVLQQCSAHQLKEIEDSTRYWAQHDLLTLALWRLLGLLLGWVTGREGGRDISKDLNVHWERCYKADFGIRDVRSFSMLFVNWASDCVQDLYLLHILFGWKNAFS